METFDSQLIAPIAPTIKQRNAFFDSLFYDVCKLKPEETDGLSPLLNREGSIINVPPAASNRPIKHYRNATEFLREQQSDVRAVVVAGVGSSALGTAALARNVANAYGIDAAGIISGYGASDMLAEAMGGWFFYGATDAMQHEIREAINRLPKTFANSSKQATSSESALRQTDISTLDEILGASPPKLSLLVGHSKGDLLIDFALERFAKKHNNTAHPFCEELRIVTFGAVTDLPRQFKRVHQFIGSIDWFGGMNSRLDVPHIKIPNAWHHLNTSLSFHLPAESVLKQYVSIN